jgi:DNA-binding IclR family transcriptional regulator
MDNIGEVINTNAGSAGAVQGAQVVRRIALLLKLIGRSPEGATTSELVRDSGLTRPTVHRLLTSLAAEGLVDQDTSTNAWHHGPEIFVMGAVAAHRFPIEDLARASLQRLAEETGESAFLSIRRGNETVCLLREEGSFPIRSFVLHEGVRFPLGVASAGLAILAFLPQAEIDLVLANRADLSEKWGAQNSAEAIRQNVSRTLLTGYAVNPGLILEGSWGMGTAVFNSAGRPTWALSLTGIEPRFAPARQPLLGRLLLEEANKITQKLRQVAVRPR